MLSINTFNLLDVRPGRAIKAFLFTFVAVGVLSLEMLGMVWIRTSERRWLSVGWNCGSGACWGIPAPIYWAY